MTRNCHFKEQVLLTSSPRSGSTFFANLIRSHPDVLFFNEIISRGPTYLPNFEREFWSGSANLSTYFEDELKRLMRYKLSFLGNIAWRSRSFLVPLMLAVKLMNNAILRLYPKGRQTFFYKAYHINSLYEPPFLPFYATQFAKTALPSVLFLKEIRPYKAYFALKSVYPRGFFIHLIRSPFGYVSSCLRFYPSEMKRAYFHRRHFAETCPQYSKLLNRYASGSFVQQLVLSWRINNELVIDRVRENEFGRDLCVKYESLVEDPLGAVTGVFELVGLELPKQTKQFITELCKKRNRKHARSTLFAKKFDKAKDLLIPKDLSVEHINEIYEVIENSPLREIWGI